MEKEYTMKIKKVIKNSINIKYYFAKIDIKEDYIYLIFRPKLENEASNVNR